MPPPVSARNGLITGYDLRAVEFGVNETHNVHVEGNATKATVTGLVPFTYYSISVRAVNEAGQSEYSFDVIQATDEDSKFQ